jgi:membrane associated rhomboid family serine protease
MSRTTAPTGDVWACGACGGRAVTAGTLRKTLPRAAMDALWEATSRPGKAGERLCPFCAAHLRALRVERKEGALDLDWCDACALVWFDAGEREAAAVGPPEAPEPQPSVVFDPPPEPCSPVEFSEARLGGGWQDHPAVLGLPVDEGKELWNRPWTTWTVGAVILVVSVLALLSGIGPVAREWGLVPATAFRHGGLDFVSSFFLHGGVLHLVGNLYFLLIFGDNVEDVLRPGKYLLLLLLATVIGDLAYVVVAHGSAVPSIGASGGIAGVLAYYALAFPHARIHTTRFMYYSAVRVTFSARTAFGLWVALQVAGAVLQSRGKSNVNALAHLGGAAAGVLFWLRWR